jgi:hypothetical protein
MEIKMPVKFHLNYIVTIRRGDWESRERCQKLIIREITPEEKEQYYKNTDEKDRPSHQVNFFYSGCRRSIEGTLTVNEENLVVFSCEGKDYEFKPFVPGE